MANWRFYGRTEELAELDLILQLGNSLDKRGFEASRIIGRRGVGKTALLKEAGRRGLEGIPVVVCELPSLEEGNAGDTGTRLERSAREAGLGNIMDSLPPRPLNFSDRMWFGEIVKHLIRNDVVVGLDEFHHAAALSLESDLKLVIDGFGPLFESPPGKLVLMGSHQQQMLRIFASDRPLYQRVYSTVRVAQWPISTVLEMAVDQGYMTRPDRFLTLWTAFGGLPRLWERFSVGRRTAKLRDFDAWPGDLAWRRAFLAEQRTTLQDPEERYDNKAFIELASDSRAPLLWLANNRPKGAIVKDFPPELKNRADTPLVDSLDILERHLELVEPVFPFMIKGPGKWRVCENSTLFQIHVFPETSRANRSRRSAAPLATDRHELELRRLETLEGYALERFAADYFRELPGTSWSASGNWRPDGGEVDLIAIREDGESGKAVVAGSCKRNPSLHKPDRVAHEFRDFFGSLGEGDEARQLRAMGRAKVLISPEFADAQRKGCGRQGFECLDIRDMARSLDLDLEPEPKPKLTAKPSRPGPGNGPSLGM